MELNLKGTAVWFCDFSSAKNPGSCLIMADCYQSGYMDGALVIPLYDLFTDEEYDSLERRYDMATDRGIEMLSARIAANAKKLLRASLKAKP